MKILYIGPYRQNEEWGQYSRNLIKSLALSNNQVAVRPVFMHTSIRTELDDDLLSLERNSYTDYDMVIQHCLPTLLEFDGRFERNVGMFNLEASINQGWKCFSELIPELWLPSEVDKWHSEHQNVKIVPVPTDTSKFEKSHSKISLGSTDDTFKFYFIGEYTQRNNIPALVKAFHLAFHPSEPVDLVLRLTHPIMGMDQLFQTVATDLENIKSKLRIHANNDCYKKEFLITQPLNEAETNALHNTCDCFVLPSHGESVSLPCLDAMGFGNTPIVSYGIGPTDYIKEDFENPQTTTGTIIPAHRIQCDITDPPLPNLYTGKELWEDIDIPSLVIEMKHAFESRGTVGQEEVRNNGRAAVYNYSFEKVAEIINAHTN